MLIVLLAVLVLVAAAAWWASSPAAEAAPAGRSRRETFVAGKGKLVARLAGYDDDGEALLVCAPGASLRTTAGGVRACCVGRPSAAAPKCGVCEFLGDEGAYELSASADCPAGVLDAL